MSLLNKHGVNCGNGSSSNNMSVSSPSEPLNHNANSIDDGVSGEIVAGPASLYSNPFVYNKFVGSANMQLLQQGLAAAAAAANAANNGNHVEDEEEEEEDVDEEDFADEEEDSIDE